MTIHCGEAKVTRPNQKEILANIHRTEVIGLRGKDLTNAQHVIKTSMNTFIVVHGGFVSLVDRKCKILKQYGCPTAPLQLSNSEYVAEVSGDGLKFVVNRRRICVFSPCLEVEPSSVSCPPASEDSFRGWWRRLCYSRSSGRLFVSWGGKYGWIYSVA